VDDLTLRQAIQEKIAELNAKIAVREGQAGYAEAVAAAKMAVAALEQILLENPEDV
jgi:hypothetical protein